jgi:hypothetical protein
MDSNGIGGNFIFSSFISLLKTMLKVGVVLELAEFALEPEGLQVSWRVVNK